MISRLLLNGILIGILAGIVSFGVLRVFVEPQMERAIAFEEEHDAVAPPVASHAEHTSQHNHDAEETAHVHGEAISRETQAGLGALVATTVFGGAVGGLFSLTFCFLHGRFGRNAPLTLSACISAFALISFVILPTLKYPATPPGVGLSGTIGERTAYYFILLIGSLVLQASFAVVYQKTKRMKLASAKLVSFSGYIVSTAILLSVLPSINEVPSSFSDQVLWDFRIYSIATQATLWIVIGVVFGWYARRSSSIRRLSEAAVFSSY